MQDKQTILIIEDESTIGNFMETVLKVNGYAVLRAKNGAEGMMLTTSHCPDLMILDLGLPDMDGVGVLRAVREWSAMPVIVVSARTQERDKVLALDIGADDYVTKPFGTAELLARVRTALRRATAQQSASLTGQSGQFHAGELTVDYDKRAAFIGGQEVHLTQNEYKIVALLSKHAGRVLTYEFILKSIWGPNAAGDNQILRVHMANIRRKLEKNPAEPQYIFTQTGVGYRMLDGN